MSVFRKCVLRCLIGLAVFTAANYSPAVWAGLVVQQREDGLHIYYMTVSPAAEPRPALKHRMWLRPNELKPGNAAIHYVRSFAENHLSGAWKKVREQHGETVYDWGFGGIAIEEMPLEEVREASAAFDTIVEQFIQPATRCRDSDWGLEVEDIKGPVALTFFLPDFQQSRSIARMLAIRTRLAIAEGHYDDAIEHLRMQFRLGRDLGREMLVVGNLIGIAIEGATQRTVVDLIAAPDSPNLYWALAELPSPLVDCTEAIRLEMTLGLRVFPPLMDAETAEHSPKKWARLVRECAKVFEDISEVEWTGISAPTEDPKKKLIVLGFSEAAYPAAKQRLLDSGMSAERVEQMAVGQVMMIDAAREYRRIADEVEKWWYVPYAEMRAQRLEMDQIWQEDGPPNNAGRAMAGVLLPALQAVRVAKIRPVWKRNALLVIEALRMHAAETGSFPESLDQIEVVPVPRNPITTEPYQYHLDGETAILEMPLSDGMAGLAYRYEITLAKP